MLEWYEPSAQLPQKVESLMPENGVIFFDGMKSDAIAFTPRITSVIDITPKTGHLVWEM